MIADDDAVDASHTADVATGGEAKKRRRRPGPKPGIATRTSIIREQVTDVSMAIRELETARDEMTSVPDYLNRRERHTAMIEPMSRLQLVRRFIDSVLERNGFSPEVA